MRLWRGDDGVVDVDVVAEDADAEEAELDGRAFVGGQVDGVLFPASRTVVAVDGGADVGPGSGGRGLHLNAVGVGRVTGVVVDPELQRGRGGRARYGEAGRLIEP